MRYICKSSTYLKIITDCLTVSMFVCWVAAFSCSVITNSYAFFTVTGKGALTYKEGMPALPTAASLGQEPWPGSKVIHEVT